MNSKPLGAFYRTPLIAILRGVTPEEVGGVCAVLMDAGFYFIEVTLDSPRWEVSLQQIKRQHGDRLLLGAGTVLSPQDVERVHAAGGQAVISPNVAVEVIRRSKEKGLISIPGCCTPTECFGALDAGADLLKIFPANVLGIGHIKALAVVLPAQARLCPTGGIDADNIHAYFAAGAGAVGVGAALYHPNIALEKLAARAQRLMAAMRSVCAGGER